MYLGQESLITKPLRTYSMKLFDFQSWHKIFTFTFLYSISDIFLSIALIIIKFYVILLQPIVLIDHDKLNKFYKTYYILYLIAVI